MANPLFREFDRYAREEARRAWQRTDAYKAIQQVRHAINTPHRVSSAGVAGVQQMMQRYASHGMRGGFFKAASGVPFQDMVREVVRYQASGGESARLVGELLGALGPMGRLLRSLLGPGSKVRGGGLENELDAAVKLLQAFAPDRLSPAFRSPATTGQVQDSLEAAIARLEDAGYEVTGPGLPKPMREGPATLFPKLPRVRPQKPVFVPPSPGQTPGRVRPTPSRPRRPASDDPLTTEEQPFLPGGVPKTTREGDRVQVELDGHRLPVDHPAVTKEMVPATSSNVHSYGYDYDSQTLYVRYLSHITGGAGSLYAYSHVPLETFLAMYQAPSKGTWLWDNVRIRGTWSGHRYDYRLAAIRDNYVPRKATFVGGGREKFIPRTVRVQNRKTGRMRSVTSALPESYAPELALPDTGAPNTGI